ncbi:MAG TPA: serine hydrolase domain-containing protein [Blastocatellia bacterium]|nr:serine hydrolase domain-containing protein [Blastocatellia bacterium]
MKRWQLHRSVVAFVGVALLLAGAGVVAQTKDDGKPDSIGARVDKLFATWDKADSPGCALGVIKDSAIVYKRGYGAADLDHDVPITPGTVFHVASLSKQFTAFAVLLLAQQGKLSLDDPVRKYIPELRDFGVPLTIRHLLHHTSGLRDQWNLLIMSGWRLSEDVVRDEDILDLVSRMKELNFKPGEQHLYSNTGFTLLAQIVKRVGGQSLREFAEANIFKPLGMARTFFRDDHSVVVKNQAYAYNLGPGGAFKLSVPNYDTVGASSLLTTVEDLARWDQNFYDYRIGNRAIIEQMQTPGTLNDGKKLGYAMGLAVLKYKGLRVVEHSGGDAGYRSHLMRFPDQRFSVACLCNVGSANPSRLARQVADIYLTGQLTEATTQNPGAVAFKLTDQQRSSKLGPYWSPRLEDLGRVTESNGKIYLSAAGGTSELTPLSENRFRVNAQPGEVTFETTEAGNALRLVISLEGSSPVTYDAVKLVVPSPAQLAEYTGNYFSDEIDSTYRVAVQEGKLVLLRKKYSPVDLQPAFTDAFTTLSILGTIRFSRDEKGRVTGFTLSAGRVRNFRFVKQS